MNAPLKVFLVDDEAPARARLRTLLADCQASLPNTLVGEAKNGIEALEKLNTLAVDVVLVDIRMPGMDGLALARHLSRFPDPPAVIFVTAYDQHAIDAFEVGALDYLLKPVRLQRLVDALGRTRRLSPEDDAILAPLAERRHFTVNDRGRVWLVPVEEALYLRAELKYVTLRTREREFVLTESLASLENEFSQDFLRIHRNCLVNRHQLAGFELSREGDETHWVAMLKDWPEHLPVSRRQAHVIKAFRHH